MQDRGARGAEPLGMQLPAAGTRVNANKWEVSADTPPAVYTSAKACIQACVWLFCLAFVPASSLLCVYTTYKHTICHRFHNPAQRGGGATRCSVRYHAVEAVAWCSLVQRGASEEVARTPGRALHHCSSPINQNQPTTGHGIHSTCSKAASQCSLGEKFHHSAQELGQQLMPHLSTAVLLRTPGSAGLRS